MASKKSLLSIPIKDMKVMRKHGACFLKHRNCLFKKASDLSIIRGDVVGIIVVATL